MEKNLYQIIRDMIINIAYSNDEFVCTQCLRTASELLKFLKGYVTETLIDDIAEQFKEITGQDIKNR